CRVHPPARRSPRSRGAAARHRGRRGRPRRGSRRCSCSTASRALAASGAVRVWMTGARGFVGSWLAPRLERAGHVVERFEMGADVCDAAAVAASLARARADAVVHLAALTSVARSFAEPEAVGRVNYLGTLNVLRAAARRAPRARVLLVTSSEIYGHAAI